MTTPFVVYDATGKIIRSGVVHTSPNIDLTAIANNVQAGQTGLATAMEVDPTFNYVLAGVVTPRPASPVSYTIAGRVITLSGVPLNARVIAGGQSGEVNTLNTDPSGSVVVTAAEAGPHTVRVISFPAIDFFISVTLP